MCITQWEVPREAKPGGGSFETWRNFDVSLVPDRIHIIVG